MAKRWRIFPHDSERVAHLQRTADIPSVLAQLLVCRGIQRADEVREFLEARLTSLRDPNELPGAQAAAERLAAAVAARRRLVVYGDYDADGMTGTSILMLCLQLLGADPSYYVPHRIEEGYGLNHEALRKLAVQGAQTIITVDCGITSIDEAQTARELGQELIITDHHDLAHRLPEADVVVHPRLPGHHYPFAGLSGAGVAFKVAWALCQEVSQSKRVAERMKTFLMQAVGLAALGTVADVVPLLDENRILVRHGLNCLREYPTPGIAALASVTGLGDKSAFHSEDIAFTLAPRLNAAGRLGQAELAVELLITQASQRAATLAQYIHQLNGTRDRLERGVYTQAHRQAEELFDPKNDAALVLASAGWHAGVIGIVAGRLAEKYHRPVVLIALDELGVKVGVGSARSAAGLDLHQALDACAHHLISHGGHAAAAGLKINPSQIEPFRAAFCEYAAEAISADDLVAELWIDAETPLSALTLQAVEQIERLAPFGQGNRRPVLCATGVSLAAAPQRIGGDGRHMAVTLGQHGARLRSVAFGGGDWADELSQISAPLAVAFKPVINNYRGRKSVELHLADWRLAAAGPTEP